MIYSLSGTSLQVYPFAGLANEVPYTTPRLLINRDSVGAFRAIKKEEEKAKEKEEKEEKESKEEESKGESSPLAAPGAVGNYRDVQVLGDSDDSILQFAKLLGWEEELLQLAQ